MYISDLKFQECIGRLSIAVGECIRKIQEMVLPILKISTEYVSSAFENLTDSLEDLNKNWCDCEQERGFKKYHTNINKSVSVERYLKSKRIDMRGVIKRNVRDHRY